MMMYHACIYTNNMERKSDLAKGNSQKHWLLALTTSLIIATIFLQFPNCQTLTCPLTFHHIPTNAHGVIGDEREKLEADRHWSLLCLCPFYVVKLLNHPGSRLVVSPLPRLPGAYFCRVWATAGSLKGMLGVHWSIGWFKIPVCTPA